MKKREEEATEFADQLFSLLSLVSLEIQDCSFLTEQIINRTIEGKRQNHNLSSLKLLQTKLSITTWTSILYHFPNIERLSLPNRFPHSADLSLIGLLGPLSGILKELTFERIKEQQVAETLVTRIEVNNIVRGLNSKWKKLNFGPISNIKAEDLIDGNINHIVSLSLSHVKESFKSVIKHLSHLKQLVLHSSTLDDEFMDILASHCSKLNDLQIIEAKNWFTDGSSRHISRLHNLQSLTIQSATLVTLVPNLHEGCPLLERVFFRHCPHLLPQTFRQLGYLPLLVQLAIDGCPRANHELIDSLITHAVSLAEFDHGTNKFSHQEITRLENSRHDLRIRNKKSSFNS